MKRAVVLFACVVAAYCVAGAQDSSQNHAAMMERGEDHAGMGFSQTTTTHHFLLTADGGTIQVTANDPQNTEQISTIQMHLQHIVGMFQNGDFSIPHFVHDQNVPGAAKMRKMRNKIQYSAEKLDNGGRVNIKTSSPEALAAIHDFLVFQIKDHQTGDPRTVPRP